MRDPSDATTPGYRCPNPFTDEDRRLYFIPHLLKTTHNCWPNSHGHSRARTLWVSPNMNIEHAYPIILASYPGVTPGYEAITKTRPLPILNPKWQAIHGMYYSCWLITWRKINNQGCLHVLSLHKQDTLSITTSRWKILAMQVTTVTL